MRATERAAALSMCLAVACGGSSGGGASGEPARTVVDFPPPAALVADDGISVRGRNVGENPPRRILVDGVRAAGGGRIGGWSATVPVAAGPNRIVVEAETGEGRRVVEALELRGSSLAGSYGTALVDAERDRLLLAVGSVQALDRSTGAIEEIYTPFVSELGTVFRVGAHPVLDPLRRRIYSVASPGRESFQVRSVDLRTGSAGVVRGFSLVGPRDLAMDPVTDRLWVAQVNRLEELDVESGDIFRSLEAPEVDGACFCSIGGIGVLPDGRRAVVLREPTDGAPPELWIVDLETGTYAPIGGPRPAPLEGARELVVDPDGARAYVLTSGDATGIVEVDLTTGERRLVTAGTEGDQPPFRRRPDGLDYDPLRARLVVSDLPRGVFLVDPATGERELAFEQLVGSGPDLDLPASALHDPAGPGLLVWDAGLEALLEVALDDGGRRVMSSAEVGTGEPLGGVLALAAIPGETGVLVLEDGRARLGIVDRASGDRELLSGAERGTGPFFSSPVGLAVDPAHDRALVADLGAAAVLAVDLASGDRAIVSSTEPSLGPALRAPTGIAVDAAGTRAWVVDAPAPDQHVLVEIDLASGARRQRVGLPYQAPVRIPSELALEADGESLLISYGGLYRMDVASGTVEYVDLPFSSGSFDIDAEAGVLYQGRAWIPDVVAHDLETGATAILSR